MPKLTKRVVDSTPLPQAGQVFLRDSELSGFALRLTRGSKTFILEKRIHGRVRRITLGPYGPLTVDQARDKARGLIGQVIQGKDPAQDRQDQRQELTFGELTALYIERHVPRKRSGYKDLYHLEKYLSEWRGRKLSAITRKDVVSLHVKIGKDAPYTANRVIALLRKMFNLGKVWGIYEGDNPATGIELFPEVKRERFISPHELPALMRSLSQEPDPYVKAAFILSLMTGARIGEVLSARWGDMDLERGLWRIPQTKAGRTHQVPLPSKAVSLLHTLPRLEGNPHVFPGRVEGAHRVNVAKAWGRIKTRAGIPDVRIHDLRRTLGSWLAGSGASLPLIGKVLNHTQPSTTSVYARLDLEPVRAALEANAERMISIAGEIPMLEESSRGEETI